MLPEIIVFKFLLCYTNYNTYYKYININKDIYKELYYIYNLLPSFFKDYPRDASVDEFSIYFFQHYPRLRTEEIDAYQRIFEQAKDAQITEESLVVSYLQEIKNRASSFSLAETALAFSEGRADADQLRAKIAEVQSTSAEVVATQTQFITDDLNELLDQTIKKQGLRWRLHSLNRALGSLRIGDFGFIFARPETGKTTLLASEITYFAEQLDRPVLWFNNEEQGNKVKLRCFQAALGVPLATLMSQQKQCVEQYKAKTGCRIQIYDSGEIYRRDVEQIVEEVRPGLIIFDQIDKIRGFEADRGDLVMGAIYQWAREIAKRVAPVIGVCQADGTGEGVKWLTMNNVAEAKTAKQAEADWILGIGKTHEPELQYVRHFNISKNKLMGDKDSEEHMRHGNWDVLIQPDIARYKDLGA